MNLGDRIKMLRRKNNLTQERLADLLCVSCQAVSKWECGVSCPDLSLIAPLTKIFHVTADELLGLDQEETDRKKKKYDDVHRHSRENGDFATYYEVAKDAVVDFPDNFCYLLWLADAEYQLAFLENQKADASCELFNEWMENCLRRYEVIISNCRDHEIFTKAALGKICSLYFLDRQIEADWSAEFEYPDLYIRRAKQALVLYPTGQELLNYLENEKTNNE